MKIIVVVPTYKEAKNIGRLIDALESEFEKIKNHEFSILVIDGNSPDGTAEIVREESKNHKNIYLLVEPTKRGLGAAYVAGMKYAIENLGAGAIIEFDGDLQHNPEDIKRLVAELDNGYDYVIGSRYVTGGGVPKQWAFYRKFLSRFGSLLIKIVLRLPVNDCTSGLKLSRVKNFAEKLPLSEDKILSKRHAYKIHLLHEMVKLGAKIKEIPIKFLEREGGNSKSSFEDIVESLRVIFLLYFK